MSAYLYIVSALGTIACNSTDIDRPRVTRYQALPGNADPEALPQSSIFPSEAEQE
ncbi:hypothetical protein [Microcoleus sp.]|uniref:hypothetical protein n=1 Tax=Microcoleus sp. TaxID=44472 RepID=UPI0035942EA4